MAVAAACAIGAAVIPLDDSEVPAREAFAVVEQGGPFSGPPPQIELAVGDVRLLVQPPAGYLITGWGNSDDNAAVTFVRDEILDPGSAPTGNVDLRVKRASTPSGREIGTRDGRPIVVADEDGLLAVAWEVAPGTTVIVSSTLDIDLEVLLATLDNVRTSG